MSGARLASVYGQVEAASGNDEQVVNILSMKCCAKVAGYFYHEKNVNHGDTENTEAKQKEENNYKKEFHAKARRRKEKQKRREEKEK